MITLEQLCELLDSDKKISIKEMKQILEEVKNWSFYNYSYLDTSKSDFVRGRDDGLAEGFQYALRLALKVED